MSPGVGDSPAFEEWALLTWERLARLMSSALHRLTAAYEQRGEYETAQSHARRQVELETWDEKAHRQLMRALALDGQRSAALAQYETCRRLLAKDPKPRLLARKKCANMVALRFGSLQGEAS
jgi:DNA-binding SARP family transcriptional activator